MAEIIVTPAGERRFSVRVEDEGSATGHEVTVSAEELERLGAQPLSQPVGAEADPQDRRAGEPVDLAHADAPDQPSLPIIHRELLRVRGAPLAGRAPRGTPPRRDSR